MRCRHHRTCALLLYRCSTSGAVHPEPPMRWTREQARAMGRRGGQTRSPRRAEASKLNGRKGGRPKTKKEYVEGEFHKDPVMLFPNKNRVENDPIVYEIPGLPADVVAQMQRDARDSRGWDRDALLRGHEPAREGTGSGQPNRLRSQRPRHTTASALVEGPASGGRSVSRGRIRYEKRSKDVIMDR
jgi:hypothetical protein